MKMRRTIIINAFNMRPFIARCVYNLRTLGTRTYVKHLTIIRWRIKKLYGNTIDDCGAIEYYTMNNSNNNVLRTLFDRRRNGAVPLILNDVDSCANVMRVK